MPNTTVKKPRAEEVVEEEVEVLPEADPVCESEDIDPKKRIESLTHDLEEANKALELEKAKYAALEKRYGRVIRLYNLVAENYIQED